MKSKRLEHLDCKIENLMIVMVNLCRKVSGKIARLDIYSVGYDSQQNALRITYEKSSIWIVFGLMFLEHRLYLVYEGVGVYFWPFLLEISSSFIVALSFREYFPLEWRRHVKVKHLLDCNILDAKQDKWWG